MSDDDLDFELVTNARQLAPPRELRRERVVLPELKTTSGKPAAFYVYELSALDYSDFQESTRVYKDGVLTSVSLKNEDLKFLSFCVRDAHGNRIWPTTEAAIAQLGQFGKATINKLLTVANRLNSGNEAATEGNSERTPTDSSPSI